MSTSGLSSTATAPASSESASSGRIVSVDALRGFDMFWIIGADAFVSALGKLRPTGTTGFLAGQLRHAQWEGFAFYDLIFPMFVFLVGVAIVFSLTKIAEREGKAAAHKRVFKRFVLLFIIGIIYYGGLSNVWSELRFLGVLQRLALAYLFGSLLFLNLRLRGMIVACGLILVGYWALVSFVPVPSIPEIQQPGTEWGQGGVSHVEANNWALYVDYYLLPGQRGGTYLDPEGILSTVPTIATALMGIFAGLLLSNRNVPERKKVLYLMGAGAMAVVAGYLLGLEQPIIKKLWNTPYVLVTGGYSSILLGVFYLVVDIGGYRKWATPFLWIGSNALTIYLAWRFVDFEELAELFTGGHIAAALGSYARLLQVAVAMLLIILVARFLYKKKIFIRL